MRRSFDIAISAALHLLNLTTMACFIAFIELTINGSNISAVHTIDTTGQLIPFVIGIISFANSIRELEMLFLRKVGILPTIKVVQHLTILTEIS